MNAIFPGNGIYSFTAWRSGFLLYLGWWKLHRWPSHHGVSLSLSLSCLLWVCFFLSFAPAKISFNRRKRPIPGLLLSPVPTRDRPHLFTRTWKRDWLWLKMKKKKKDEKLLNQRLVVESNGQFYGKKTTSEPDWYSQLALQPLLWIPRNSLSKWNKYFFWVWVEQFSQKNLNFLERMRQKFQILMERTSALSKQPSLVSGI